MVTQRTNLLQLYVDNVWETPRVISENHTEGVPLMAVTKSTPCFTIKLNVPNGIYTLGTRWGADRGMM